MRVPQVMRAYHGHPSLSECWPPDLIAEPVAWDVTVGVANSWRARIILPGRPPPRPVLSEGTPAIHAPATSGRVRADAAWATADTLHAAAKALHSPILRCVAAGYDRAARAPYGRIPRRSQQGNQLRTAARLLAMTGAGPGDLIGQVGVLVANLMELADAVAALREAQAHAAQAAASREAAEHLHTALTQARGRRPHFGQAHTRPAQASSSPGRVEADFPVPLAEALQAVTQDVANRRSWPHTRQPPTRARPAR
jgi:hypothetical protein